VPKFAKPVLLNAANTPTTMTLAKLVQLHAKDA
jgi:hypothetical protein